MTDPYDDDLDNYEYNQDDAKIDAYRRLVSGEQGLLDDPAVFAEDSEFEGFKEEDF